MKIIDRSKKIITYSWVAIILVIIIISVYLYFFYKDNVFETIFFDETKYTQTEQENNNLNIQLFNDVVQTIEDKKIKTTANIKNFFN